MRAHPCVSCPFLLFAVLRLARVVCGVSRVSLSLPRVPALLHYTYVPVSLSLSCPVCVPSGARAPAVSLLVFVTDCDQRPIMRG